MGAKPSSAGGPSSRGVSAVLPLTLAFSAACPVPASAPLSSLLLSLPQVGSVMSSEGVISWSLPYTPREQCNREETLVPVCSMYRCRRWKSDIIQSIHVILLSFHIENFHFPFSYWPKEQSEFGSGQPMSNWSLLSTYTWSMCLETTAT